MDARGRTLGAKRWRRLIARGSSGESGGMEDGSGEADGPLEVPVKGLGGRVGRAKRRNLDQGTPEFRAGRRLGDGRRSRRRGRLVRARGAVARLRPGGALFGRRRRTIEPERVQADARAIARVLAPGLRRPGRDQGHRQERQGRSDDRLHQPDRWGCPHESPMALGNLSIRDRAEMSGLRIEHTTLARPPQGARPGRPGESSTGNKRGRR